MKPLPQESTPKLAVEQRSREPGTSPDLWIVAWAVRNLSLRPLQLLRGRLPHSSFLCPEQALIPPQTLEPGESGRLEFSVFCPAPRGTVVENAFLILQGEWLRRNWWIFTRLRVVMEDRGPEAATEDIATHPVGFSQ